jgi:hypothetical protein
MHDKNSITLSGKTIGPPEIYYADDSQIDVVVLKLHSVNTYEETSIEIMSYDNVALEAAEIPPATIIEVNGKLITRDILTAINDSASFFSRLTTKNEDFSAQSAKHHAFLHSAIPNGFAFHSRFPTCGIFCIQKKA